MNGRLGTRSPASFAQEQLWFLDRMAPGSARYIVPVVVELDAVHGAAVVAAALDALRRRHEVLRAAFRQAEGGVAQIVRHPASQPLPVVDLRRLPAGTARAEAERLEEIEGDRPFDLETGPLLRAMLVRLREGPHRVFLIQHHMVTDAWSAAVLRRELDALSSDLSRGRPSSLAALPLSYADFAVRQRRRLRGGDLDVLIRFWREELGGEAPALDLPTDRAPGVRRFRGGVRRFRVPEEVTAALRVLARRAETSPATVLLAGFQAVLGRVRDRRKLIVGCAVAGRKRPELKGLAGCFSSVLPVSGDLRRDPPFRELVARVRERHLAVEAHQELPFAKVVAELAPARHPDRHPLFQVSFSYLGAMTSGMRWLNVRTARFDLELHVERAGEALAASLIYDRDLFDAATVERLGRRIGRLLAAAAGEPGRRLSELPLLSAGERHALLCEWNAGPEAVPRPRSVPELFRRQAAARPDATAVACGAERLSYGELAGRSARLACRLRRHGVAPEVPVGVLAGASCERVESFLAVLEAGGVYVPLDPDHPETRLRFMVDEVRIPLVLGRARPARTLAENGPRRLDPRDGRAAAGAGTPAADGRPHPDHLAYVVYTSGSTGRPKAVGATHGGLANLCLALASEVGLGRESRLLQFSSPGFDASVWELAGALTAGASLHLGPREDLLPGPPLAAFLERRRITVTLLTPSTLAAVDRRLLPELTTLIVGGESCPPRLAREWSAGRQGFNAYGPSEATVCATLGRLAGGPGVPIGRAVAGLGIYLLDSGFRPLPPGAPGELAIAGRGVARGYLGRPAATAELFVPDPFGRSAGGRMYRTGDRARFLHGGELEFLGRADHQIKLRGVRIELGEIEAALAEHPRLREAVVTVPEEDDPARRRLVAYVVPAGDAAADADARLAAELESHLARRLPRSMVPSAFVALDALPLTANGKVDLRALPPPPRKTRAAGAPRTAVEEVLAAIWEEVLALDRVGTDEDFFALGGHSLNATRVAARVRQVLGVELPVRALFEMPTVAALARRAESLLGAATPAPAVPRRPAGSEAPLAFAQRRLWLLDRLTPGRPAYHIPLVVDLEGPLRAAALAAALREIVRRHEVLRTTVAEVAGEPVQRIHPAPAACLPAVDLGGLAAPRRRAEARRLASRAALEPFDLERGPLFSSALLALGPAEHRLVLTLHHIVADGWSLGVLFRELSALYEGACRGAPPPLPELAIQYADYAAWQRRWVSGDLLARQLGYWQGKLGANPPPLELTADRPRPAARRCRGATLPVEVPAYTTERLRGLGRRHGATLAMTLLAAVEILLCGVTGRTRCRVGTPLAGRTRAELEPLIGLFVNLVVMAAELAEDPSFDELLERVRREALEAHAHQDLPFEKLVEGLGLDRDPSRNPLFQVVFALQNAPVAAPRFAGLGAELRPIETPAARFDVELHVWEGPDGLTGHCTYDADLFDATTVGRLLGGFRVLLEAVVAAPATAAATLPRMTRAECHQLAVEWNDTAGRTGSLTLTEVFEHRARRRPDAVAVVCRELALSFAELGRRSRRLARRLRRREVGDETRVGLALERSPDLVVGMLGVTAAGGCYVPLDPEQPEERSRWMTADAGVRLVVTAGAAARRGRRLRGPEVELLVLDAGGGRRAAADPGPAAGRAGAAASRLAYVVYTSGSTGRPKGIAVPRRGVERLVLGGDYVRLEPEDRVAQAAHAAFDAATFEIWGALAAGARLEILPRASVLDPRRLSAALAERRITALFLTTALFDQVARAVPDAFAGLTHLLFGGEEARPEGVRAVLRHGPPRRLLHVYGPSENTTFTTWHRVTAEPAAAAGVPIGMPVAGTSVLVLDRRLRTAPPGAPGELCAGGDGLARGYHGRPGRSAESFVPDPYGEIPGSRLYRTGDLVRRLPDGAVDFLGRLDLQVKIRGFRVEPGEVEAALTEHPRVREAAVVARGRDTLAAFVVPRQGEPEAAGLESELRGALARRLPEHMVPTAWALLAALPLGPNGKVDRKALARMELPAPHREAAAAAPRGPVEEMIAAIWEDVLERGRVGPEDDFFTLGGHSLNATRVVSRVRELLRVELPLRAVFDGPTVRALARRVEASSGSAGGPLPPVSRRPHDGSPPPLSYAQQRLWFLDKLVPGNPFYNIAHVLRLRGRLRPAALGAVLAEIAGRHEVLRTTFTTAGGGPVQVIHPPSSAIAGPVRLPRIDLRRLGPARSEAEALRLVSAEATRPFDLGRGPLWRRALVALGPEDHLLYLAFHHIVADGWSLGVFHHELAALYGRRTGGAPPLPELPVQYADFALWQRRRLGAEVFTRQLAYWKAELGDGATAFDLPTDRPRAPLPAFGGAAAAFELPPALADALRSLARRRGATLAMTLLAGFYALLSRTAGEARRIPVGSPIAGRTRAELEGMIGFFVNSLVLAGDAGGDPSAGELLQRVRETSLAAYAHQDLPFEKLVEELEPGRDVARNPLFQVLFAFQNAPMELPELPGLAVERFELEVRTTRLDLELHLWESGAGLRGLCAYDRQLFDATTLRRFTVRYRRILAAFAAAPAAALSELSLLGAGERHQVLSEWSLGCRPGTPVQGPAGGGQNASRPPGWGCPPSSDPGPGFPDGARGADRRHGAGPRSVAEVFTVQARRTPEAVALVGGALQLSYGGLARRAGELAGVLRGRGVGPEVPVGVVAERSPETFVGVLAVLLAGGAYVPLEPSYPEERLRFITADAGIRVVLTSRASARWGPAAVDLSQVRKAAGREEPAAADGVDLAYVIYTSGSTGRPKGVAMRHVALVNLLAWQRRSSGGGRTLQFASLSFDVSLQEIFSTWGAGGTLVLISHADRLEPRRLLDVLRRRRIERLFLPPSALRHLAAAAAEPPDSLREVLAAGEPLRLTAAVRGFLARLRGGRLFNQYGPTETHVVASWVAAAGGPLPEQPPVGRPIAGARCAVLDRGLDPVPAGSPGELCVGGVALGRGYLGRAPRTAERWVPDPFAGPPGGRLYRTGDRARHRARGELEFLGRADGQVKVRGQRIELGEVEAVLGEHPAVREAAVLCREVAGAARLWGCVVPRGRPAPGLVPELREALCRKLPAVMVPASLVVLESLPRTAGGKVDRPALTRDTAARALLRPELETAFEAPRTELEEAVSGIWREALGLDRVGVHDNFFEVGGHSLALVRVQESMRRTLGRELTLVELFRHPTIHALAGHLTNGHAAPPSHARAERGGKARAKGCARMASRRARRRPASAMER